MEVIEALRAGDRAIAKEHSFDDRSQVHDVVIEATRMCGVPISASVFQGVITFYADGDFSDVIDEEENLSL